jgi:uroporphyrinogen-III synthase
MSSEKINKLLNGMSSWLMKTGKSVVRLTWMEFLKKGLKNLKNVAIFAVGPFCCSQTL